MTEPIDKKTFNRQLARLAVPIAIQSLMLALVAACDVLIILDYDFWIDFSCKTSPADNRDKLRRRGMGKESRDKENVLPHDNRYGTDSFDERHTVPTGNMRSFHGGRRGR